MIIKTTLLFTIAVVSYKPISFIRNYAISYSFANPKLFLIVDYKCFNISFDYDGVYRIK